MYIFRHIPVLVYTRIKGSDHSHLNMVMCRIISFGYNIIGMHFYDDILMTGTYSFENRSRTEFSF